MYQQELKPNVDYLYCEECGRHVSCIRLGRGIWEVQCPRCEGKCGLCACQAGGHCVGKNGATVGAHVYIASAEARPGLSAGVEEAS